ncbi:FmdB family zinc ribbon protein [Chroococcus sp. FPU101]|uniref:FmdB family zinc ribbon protein n=1 Tax=Chroococcus sp. FPU101 TaxID=1974212 RepID=UPI001A8C7BE9|nr:zinc ribbon domain-containing protein [Chroococcus sp. FPU101]
MPLYEYCCTSCGEFEAWRTLAELEQPMSCPNCNLVAKRLFSPPMVNLNSVRLKQSSKNPEPKLIKHNREEPETPRVQNAKTARPWMISHSPPRY